MFYNKRLVKDGELRDKRREAGHKGGSPKLGVNYNKPGFVYLFRKNNGLIKIGISSNPDKRLYKIRKQTGENVEILCKIWVENMGVKEREYHEKYKDYQKEGEWFDIPFNILINDFPLKGYVKGNDKGEQEGDTKGESEAESENAGKTNPPPSSSSSPSSSVSSSSSISSAHIQQDVGQKVDNRGNKILYKNTQFHIGDNIKVDEAAELTCEIWNIGQVRNANAFMQIYAKLNLINKDNGIEHYLEATHAYKKYKLLEREKFHNYHTYLGDAKIGCRDGQWCDRNWIEALRLTEKRINPDKQQTLHPSMSEMKETENE